MQPDPTPYPKVDIGGTSYELMFRTGDVIRLKKAGIDLGVQLELSAMEAVEYVTTVLQAAIAHQAQIEIEDLRNMVPWAQIPEIQLAIAEAVSKVSAQAIALKPAVKQFKAKQELMRKADADQTVQ